MQLNRYTSTSATSSRESDQKVLKRDPSRSHYPLLNFKLNINMFSNILSDLDTKTNIQSVKSSTTSRDNDGIQKYVNERTSTIIDNHGDAIKELSDNIMKEFLSESLQLSDIRYGYFDMDKTVPTTQCVMDEADMDTDMPPEPNTLSKGISLMLSFGFLCFTSFVVLLLIALNLLNEL